MCWVDVGFYSCCYAKLMNCFPWDDKKDMNSWQSASDSLPLAEREAKE